MEIEQLNEALKDFTALNSKITDLRTFLLDETKVKNLDTLNRDLLISQLKAMEAYISILSIRIGLNSPRSDSEKAPETENKGE